MRDFRTMAWTALWMAGLVVALLTGNLSLYLILSALYFGSRWVSRRRALHEGDSRQLEP